MGRRRGNERGHLMIALVAAVAILMISFLMATESWIDILRRDNEKEMIFRAQEIVRALQRYQKDRGTLPTSLDQLIEPGSRGQYFLRKQYKDPLVRNGKWGLLFAAPGGGVVDPNAAGSEEAPQIGSMMKTKPKLGGIGGGIPGGTEDMKGLPIAGVKTLCKEKPFRLYKGQGEYAQWLFTIYDLQGNVAGQPGAPGGGAGGRPPGGRPPGGRPPGGG